MLHWSYDQSSPLCKAFKSFQSSLRSFVLSITAERYRQGMFSCIGAACCAAPVYRWPSLRHIIATCATVCKNCLPYTKFIFVCLKKTFRRRPALVIHG
eukprot:scaffold267876_cov45-Prasinocladus_malaysianus.AAC.1